MSAAVRDARCKGWEVASSRDLTRVGFRLGVRALVASDPHISRGVAMRRIPVCVAGAPGAYAEDAPELVEYGDGRPAAA